MEAPRDFYSVMIQLLGLKFLLQTLKLGLQQKYLKWFFEAAFLKSNMAAIRCEFRVTPNLKMFLMTYFISLPNLVLSSQNTQLFCYAAVLYYRKVFTIIAV